MDKKKSNIEERLLAQTMFHKVLVKVNHTFKNLKTQPHQVSTERYEFQTRLKQQQQENPLQWENLLGEDKIDDPRNLITITMKTLPSLISIFQYYKAYEPYSQIEHFTWYQYQDRNLIGTISDVVG